MTVPGLIPEAGTDEHLAHTNARRSWLAAETSELNHHRAQNAGSVDSGITKLGEVPVNPVRGGSGCSGMDPLQCENEGGQGDVESLSSRQQVILGHCESLLIKDWARLSGLVDSCKRKIALLFGRAD